MPGDLDSDPRNRAFGFPRPGIPAQEHPASTRGRLARPRHNPKPLVKSEVRLAHIRAPEEIERARHDIALF